MPSGQICKLGFGNSFFLRKNPVFIPEEAPDAKETGRDKEADVGRDADGV